MLLSLVPHVDESGHSGSVADIGDEDRVGELGGLCPMSLFSESLLPTGDQDDEVSDRAGEESS